MCPSLPSTNLVGKVWYNTARTSIKAFDRRTSADHSAWNYPHLWDIQLSCLVSTSHCFAHCPSGFHAFVRVH